MRESGRTRSLAVRLYAALTRLLPGPLGRRFGAQVADVFEELHGDAVRDGGWVRGWGLWARSTGLLLVCAVRERLEGRARGTTNTGGRDLMMGLLRDARYGVRTLVKRPGFSVTAILILAAGIGATTTIFSVVDTVVLRPLPYPDAGRLVHFDEGAHSYPSLRAWSAMSSFEAVAAVRDQEVHLTGEGAPETLRAVSVSREFFRMFGAAPRLGRLFDSGDYPGDRSVAVLGDGLWQRRFGGDPEVVGRTLSIDGEPTVVVGILAPDFRTPELNTGSRVDVWFALGDGGADADDHGWHVLGVMARLAPGVTLEAAQAEVDAQRVAVAEVAPINYHRRDGSLETTPLVPLREATVQRVKGTLLMLLGAVGLLLLIACANVANLFLAHGTSRAREIALRGALGASRLRIASQVLTESVTLALAGGVFGVVVAYGGVELFTLANPGGIPRIDTLSVDMRVLGFSLVVSMGTGVVFGMLPALHAMRSDVGDALKAGAAAVTQSRSGRRVRSGLVVVEIALAVVLVTGAGLLARSFVERLQVDPGFDSGGLVIVPLDLGAGYDEPLRLQFNDALLERVRAMPGVRGAAAGWTSPLKYTGGNRCCWRTRVTGDPSLVDEENPFRGISHPVSPGYFATLGASFASGRDFTADDGRGSPAVAILNRPAAVALFGTEDVVGRTITHGGEDGETLEVVGVVDGVHHWGPTEGVEEAVYVPYARYGTEFGDLDLIARSETDADVLAPALREAIWALDPDLPVPDVTTMERRISGALATPRFLSGLVGGFALVALLLACGGIYGSMLYTVGQRRREMGIRLALGAEGRDVVRLVLRQGLVLAAAGVGIGLVAGRSASGVLERLLWGVEPTDPLTFVVVALTLSATAVGAALVPAWRAGRTDPVQTLRAD